MDSGVFHWNRSVPLAWAEDLARYAPRVERASHLVLFWESGTLDEPVQRWVIYQATPLAYVPKWKLGAFHGEPSCTCAIQASDLRHCSKCLGLQSPGRDRIRRYLEKTECLALPYWVIQGGSGGHRYQYTDVEKSWMQLAGASVDPPVPGSLPYTEFDARVIRQLRRFDFTRFVFANLTSADKHNQVEAYREFRRALSIYASRRGRESMSNAAFTL